ncbi:MAG: aminopeptidase P family N-terminal domain-containing protein, partial [Ilumatobacteraceae bacterium]
MRLALPPIDHAARVRTITEPFSPRPGNAVLFTDLTDIRWLTGFGGSNGWVVVRSGEVILGTDGRYGDRARAETAASGATVIAEQQRARLHERLIESLAGAERVGLDPRTTTQADWARLAVDLPLQPLDSPVKT